MTKKETLLYYASLRVGETHFSNQGCKMKIIEYFGKNKCTVEFDNGYIKRNLSYKNISLGNVKNKKLPSVFGVGFIGSGKYDRPNYPIHYKKWKGMLERSYSEKYHEVRPTYKNVTVCEEWHNFQNFAVWFEENYIEGFELDKDILVKGNKIYSPDTCCFVPAEINLVMAYKCVKDKKYPVGVHKEKSGRFLAICTIDGKPCRLGMFDTPEEAFQVYKTEKEKYIKKIADKWKDKISNKVYEAMYSYKVEITD